MYNCILYFYALAPAAFSPWIIQAPSAPSISGRASISSFSFGGGGSGLLMPLLPPPPRPLRREFGPAAPRTFSGDARTKTSTMHYLVSEKNFEHWEAWDKDRSLYFPAAVIDRPIFSFLQSLFRASSPSWRAAWPPPCPSPWPSPRTPTTSLSTSRCTDTGSQRSEGSRSR